MVEEGQKKVVMTTSPTVLLESELTTCSQSMIVDETGDTTNNVSMETNANSNSNTMEPEEELDPKTQYNRKLRSSGEWEEFEVVKKRELPLPMTPYTNNTTQM